MARDLVFEGRPAPGAPPVGLGKLPGKPPGAPPVGLGKPPGKPPGLPPVGLGKPPGKPPVGLGKPTPGMLLGRGCLLNMASKVSPKGTVKYERSDHKKHKERHNVLAREEPARERMIAVFILTKLVKVGFSRWRLKVGDE
jgi:hypothetical protein